MLHSHVTCELLITGICNLACDYCCASGLAPVSMSTDIAHRSIDLFCDLASGASTAEFVITGGEPLTQPDLIVDIICHINSRAAAEGIRSTIVVKTNGTISSRRLVDIFRISGTHLCISVDGIPEVHDRHRIDKVHRSTSKKIHQNVKTFIDSGISCSASYTVLPDAVTSTAEGIKLLHKIGFRYINLAPAYGRAQWGPTDIDRLRIQLLETARFVSEINANGGELLNVTPIALQADNVDGKLKDHWGCNAGSATLAFLPDGSVTGCSALAMLTDRFPELILGDVFSGLSQLKVSGLQDKANAGPESRRRCQSCSSSVNCSGGCMAINLASNGTFLAPPDFYCSTIASISPAWEIAWPGANQV